LTLVFLKDLGPCVTPLASKETLSCRSNSLSLWCAVTALLVLFAHPLLAQAVDADASVRVHVSDAQRQPVPGATCSITVATSVPVTSTTDEQGLAVFPALRTGTYVVRVEMPGFEPAQVRDVLVRNGALAEVEVVLEVGTFAETVTVESRRPVDTGVSAGAAPPAASFVPSVLRLLPITVGTVQDALPLVPSVVRSATGEISMKGGTDEQSAFLLNGLNESDPSTGGFRLALPVDAVEAVQVFLHPYTAELGQFTTGITKVETRAGGEHWHAEINDFLPDLRFVRGRVIGIAEDAPHLNANGPLLKDRLFLSQSGSYTIAKRPVRGLDFPDNETKTQAESVFTQLDATLSRRHTETVTFGYFPARLDYVGLDLFRPRPVTPSATHRDLVVTGRENAQILGGLLTSSVSVSRFDTRIWPQGTGDMTLTPTVEAGSYFASQTRRAGRVEVLTVFTLPTRRARGTHDIKFGVDLNTSASRLQYSASPVNVVRNDGTLAQRIEFEAAPGIRARNREYVGFAQDRWTLRSNLTLDLGIRYEDERIADAGLLAPRAGFAWAPAGGATVIRGGVGFFYGTVPLNIRSFGQYPSRTITRFAEDGVSIVDTTRLTPLLVSANPGSSIERGPAVDQDAFVPESLTWNIQLDRTIRTWLAVRANVLSSASSNLYIVNPEHDAQGEGLLVLGSTGRATYRALEMTARIGASTHAVTISYTRSRARGDLNDFNSSFGDFASPIVQRNQYSQTATDVPNRLLVWGSVMLPWRTTIAPVFEVRTGFPYTVLDAAHDVVGIRNADGTRFPRFIAADLEVARDFRLTDKYAVRLSLRGFNLTNHFNPRDVQANVDGPGFGQFLASYHRYFTGGFDIVF
jgi:hypothetical protein